MGHYEISPKEKMVTDKTTNLGAKISTDSEAFDVLIMATMSAGKSSLVNALIGQELLHVANEATTACHTRIEHRRSAKCFTGTRYTHSNLPLDKQQKVSLKKLIDWNACEGVRQVVLSGRFKADPIPSSGLVLHDTPGPNNSQDDRHARMALEVFQTVPFKTLLYVINASQLGTYDDRKLLEQLHEAAVARNGATFGFVLNKVDLLDPEKGEHLPDHVGKTRYYLEGIGFNNPVVIPSMASTALYARKVLSNEPLSRAQRLKLQQALSDCAINPHALVESALVPEPVKRQVFQSLDRLERPHKTRQVDPNSPLDNELRKLILCSGLGMVEAFIKYQRKLSTTA